MKSSSCTPLKILALVFYLAMLAVNALSTLLPINGVTPDQVSDTYANLFAPAGLTFSVWGLIYLLLALFCIWQLVAKSAPQALLCHINVYFIISSIANICWIFAWHYEIIPLSMALILIMLVCLIAIMRLITEEQLTTRELFFIKLPFAVYTGWLTVATIANATVLLVSLGWDGFGLPESVWTMIILAVGTVIAIAAGLRFKSPAYLLTIVWAYAGILIKHLSDTGFAGAYPGVITTAGICLALLAAAAAFAAFRLRRAQAM